MKKYVICILLCFLMSLTFVGCSKSEVNAPSDKEEMVKDEGVVEDENTIEEKEDVECGMNLEELFQQGMDSYAEKDMEPPVLFPETDIEYLESFYPGISYANIKQ
ncbi:MAG: hypothetical protein U0K95_07465, partial [Eubacterium sp.]|nr:hypothetical protein [Eubacterium sp.]